MKALNALLSRRGPRSYPLHDIADAVSDCSTTSSSSLYSACSTSSVDCLVDFDTVQPVKPSKGTAIRKVARLKDRQTAQVEMEATYDLPPHVLFNLLADPGQHDTIFDSIESATSKLIEEDGPRKKWLLDYEARWSFWKVSGVCTNKLWMWTDAHQGTVKFELREPGFLRTYSGVWTISPACGTPMAACYRRSGGSFSSDISSRSPSSSLPSTPVPASPVALTAATSARGGAFAPDTGPVASMTLAGRFMGMFGSMESSLRSMYTRAAAGDLATPGTPEAKLKKVPSFSDTSSRIGTAEALPPLPTSSIISISTISSPKITPPYPINQVLKGQATGQLEEMLEGLVRAAQRKLHMEPLII